MKRVKKTVKLIILLTLIMAVIYVVRNIIASFVYFTSFPWWSAFVFGAFYYGPVLVIEGLLYGVLALAEKRKK